MDVTTQLMGRYALLMAADEVHGNESLDKRQFGVLEDCTNKAREVLVALCAMEASTLCSLAMVLATIGANNITVSPTAFDEAASFIMIIIGWHKMKYTSLLVKELLIKEDV